MKTAQASTQPKRNTIPGPALACLALSLLLASPAAFASPPVMVAWPQAGRNDHPSRSRTPT